MPNAQHTRRTCSKKAETMRILFVCVENAGRSQMAEAFAKKYGADAMSAGTLPSDEVSPVAVKAMLEKGIDLSRSRPKALTLQMIENADTVVTMGCSVEGLCPAPMLAKMQKKLIEWNIEDPKGQPIEKVRQIRDGLEQKILDLLRTQDPS
jgi:arsenate reductase